MKPVYLLALSFFVILIISKYFEKKININKFNNFKNVKVSKKLLIFSYLILSSITIILSLFISKTDFFLICNVIILFDLIINLVIYLKNKKQDVGINK